MIKASEIKPGMVIAVQRGVNYEDACLILATTGITNVEYTYLDYQDSYGGAMIGSINGEKKVKVIVDKNRAIVIEKIKNDVFKNLHDIEQLVDTIRLIEAMSDQ